MNLEDRARAAIKRITDGAGCMRVPAEETDPDLVIGDLLSAIKDAAGELHEQAALYRRGQDISDERTARAYTQAARRVAAILSGSPDAGA